MNNLQKYKYVKIMFEYSATCLWDKEGKNADINHLTENKALVEFIDLYTKILNYQDPYKVNAKKDFIVRQSGLDDYLILKIQKLIKEEHPDWLVDIYKDHSIEEFTDKI